jgi:single-strand DNA-binding protein
MAGRSLNKVILIGNLGKDPEVSYLGSGVPVAKFSVATSERWKDQEGNFQERTEWHNIVAWRRLAEICGQYLKKGSKVYLEGKLQTRSWDDKNTGVKKYMTEVVVDDMIMLDSKGQGMEAAPDAPSSVASESGGAEKEDLPF